jgi:hypothetical protein
MRQWLKIACDKQKFHQATQSERGAVTPGTSAATSPPVMVRRRISSLATASIGRYPGGAGRGLPFWISARGAARRCAVRGGFR